MVTGSGRASACMSQIPTPVPVRENEAMSFEVRSNPKKPPGVCKFVPGVYSSIDASISGKVSNRISLASNIDIYPDRSPLHPLHQLINPPIPAMGDEK